MALRRPAAPRLHAGSPGVPVAPALPAPAAPPVAPAGPAAPTVPARPVTPAAPPVTPAAPIAPAETVTAAEPTATPAAAPPSASAPSPAPPSASAPRTGERGMRRRTVLLAGAAAAAVTGAVSAGALLTRGEGRSLASAPGGSSSSPFSDVDDGADDLDAMVWADSVGVLPALADGTYAPSSGVTRGDVAVALHRFAGSPEVPGGLPALIVDLGDVPEQAAALLWLHGRGALWGDADLKVHPDRSATVADASGLLAALLRPALDGEGLMDGSSADTDWLQEAGIAPSPSPGAARADQSAPAGDSDLTGDSDATRAGLAAALHRANTVVVDALD